MSQRILQGGPAYSPFRLDALRKRMEEAEPATREFQLEAHFLYLLHMEQDLNAVASDQLQALLNSSRDFQISSGFFITPRKGTISPWSSKATDILHNCGLRQVRRVERGIHINLYGPKPGQALPASALGDAVYSLHDKMTEGVYDSLDNFSYGINTIDSNGTSKGFPHHTWKALVDLDVIHDGKNVDKK